MKLSEYLDEVSHAVATVLNEIHKENEHLARLQAELAALTAATEDGYRRADFLALNPDLDDEGLGTAIHWDTYFGVDKDRYYKDKDAASTAERVTARKSSVAALSGSVLQYAKQGLALQFGPQRTDCPVGREVGRLPMHEIIWHGRNQALHWEEGEFRAPTTNCFEHLAVNVDAQFAEYKTRSMAYELLLLLEWRTLEDFQRDMALFTP